MKKLSIIPAVVLGLTTFAFTASVFADVVVTERRNVDPITGLVRGVVGTSGDIVADTAYIATRAPGAALQPFRRTETRTTYYHNYKTPRTEVYEYR